MEVSIMLGSIFLIRDWKKGDVFQFECPKCGFLHVIQLNEENTEEVMFNHIIECQCGEDWQMLA